MFEDKKCKLEKVSIVMPCFNEAEHIGQAIEGLIALDYPKDLMEIIIVDDKSNDNSVEVIKRYVKKYKNIRLIVHKTNSGCAAGPTNTGIKNAKFDYIAVADADSVPDKLALRKMLGFLQAEKDVKCVTCSILSKKSENVVQKMQELEYITIAFTRRLLDFVDGVYVAPGPFALYEKKALIEVGLFDTKNLTQDIEMTWKLMSKGYKVRMCLAAKVYSATPTKLRAWLKQRIRWNIGGIQTIFKYKSLFFRRGMLGTFVIPLFSVSMFLGMFGLFFFFYLFFKRFLVSYLSTKYALFGGTALISLQDFSLIPSVMNFFAIILFLIGFWFTVFGLKVVKGKDYVKNYNLFSLLLYLIVYLSVFPIVLVISIYKFAIGRYSW